MSWHSFGKGQTRRGSTFRKVGQSHQSEYRGLEDGQPGADRGAEQESDPYAGEVPYSQPGISALADCEPWTDAAHLAAVSDGYNGRIEGQGP